MKSLFGRFHDISLNVIAHNNLLFHSASMILCLKGLLVSHDFSCAYAGDEITRKQNNAILRSLANEIIIENSTNPSLARLDSFLIQVFITLQAFMSII